jgi:hypothetical protein
MRPADIAREFGTSEWTVHHPPEPPPPSYGAHTASHRRRLARHSGLYELGESLRQLSLKIGFSDKTIKKALIEAGVEGQDRRRKR